MIFLRPIFHLKKQEVIYQRCVFETLKPTLFLGLTLTSIYLKCS